MDWTYNLCISPTTTEIVRDPLRRRLWIVERVERLLNALVEFARVEDVTVDTHSDGEEAFAIHDWQDDKSQSELIEFLQETNDAVNIDFTLTLQCLKPGDSGITEEFLIKAGGNLFMFIELDDKGELDTHTDSPIWLSFSLDVDIYAPISWGQQRNNTQLAELNASRLSDFLHRIEEDVPAEFLGVDAPDYRVDQYGLLASFPAPWKGGAIRTKPASAR